MAKDSPQKRAARRHEWYAAQYWPIEAPSDVFLAAAFPVLQAQVRASVKRNTALLRRLKKRPAR